MSTTTSPDVSIIIPARDAVETIGRTLDAILAQEYDGALEILVADGSDTMTMATWIRHNFPSVNVVSNPKRIIPTGLNRAIQASTGEIVVRCDAHAILPPTYVRDVVLLLEKTNAACVGGMAIPVGDSFFGKAVALAVSSPLGSGDSCYKVGGTEGSAEHVYLGAWRRETLDNVGIFNESLAANEDYELNWRIRKSGGIIWFDPTLKATYRTRNTAWALAKQGFTYGRWKALMLGQHPGSLRLRQLAPPMLLLGLVISPVAGSATNCMWIGVALPALYATVLVIGSVMTAFRRREWVAAQRCLLMPLALCDHAPKLGYRILRRDTENTATTIGRK